MPSITYIGSTLEIATGMPATQDAATYAGLSWNEVGKIISAGEVGDSSEDVTIPLLKTGRMKHVNGVQDIGDIAILAEFDSADARQTLIQGSSGTNTVHSFRLTDTDGGIQYFHGVLADYRVTERTASSFKGINFTLRGQSAIVTHGPPAIQVRESPFRVNEGNSERKNFFFKLSAQPSGNVTVAIALASDAPAGVTLQQDSNKTFTAANWDEWQFFRVRQSTDSDTADATTSVTLTASGGGYNSVVRTVEIVLVDSG